MDRDLIGFRELVDWLCGRDGRELALIVTGAGPVEVRLRGRLGATAPPSGATHIFVLTVDDAAITISAAAFRTAQLVRGGSVEADFGGMRLHFTERD